MADSKSVGSKDKATKAPPPKVASKPAAPKIPTRKVGSDPNAPKLVKKEAPKPEAADKELVLSSFVFNRGYGTVEYRPAEERLFAIDFAKDMPPYAGSPLSSKVLQNK